MGKGLLSVSNLADYHPISRSEHVGPAQNRHTEKPSVPVAGWRGMAPLAFAKIWT